jgi:hypothetical protein
MTLMVKNGFSAPPAHRKSMGRGALKGWKCVVLAGLLGANVDELMAATAVTYQGQLTSAGVTVNGVYDFTFNLYDAPINGSPIGITLTNSSVLVSNGLFTTTLDFGSDPFKGEGRWLEIAVRTDTNAFTILSPRQPLSATPYAISALSVTAPGAFRGSFTGDGSGLTNLNLALVVAATNDLNSSLMARIVAATNELDMALSTKIGSATNDLNSILSARMDAATNDLKAALSATISNATNDLNSSLSAKIDAATNASWLAGTNWVASQGFQLTNGLTRKPMMTSGPSGGTNYVVDFANEVVQITATNNINLFQSTNRTAAGWYAESVWYIQGGTANRTIRFNTNWTRIGTLATNIPYLASSNKLTIIALSVRGPGETNVAYAIARQE